MTAQYCGLEKLKIGSLGAWNDYERKVRERGRERELFLKRE